MSKATVLGLAMALIGGLCASVAFAATLPVSTSKITTASVAVTIPPTTCTLTPVADATVDRTSQNSNFGAATSLFVRAQNGPRQKRSLLRFDIPSCGIPSGAVIESAALSLTMISPAGSDRTYGVHRVTQTWGESTVTFSDQPPFDPSPLVTVSTGMSIGTLSWSVLSEVDGFIKGTLTNNGWLVKDTNEMANPAIETVFGSRENGLAAHRPTLVIGYYE